ncbi:hypothetical protein GGX14DRAFT_557717 [Mycena pura]|uniref:Uncharacterized protein n=1 Tax=Mycena pura TaxID=153505 RepID=A0AAD7E0W7_9AGAR|nr:hypothetical protein GGX14DRAFT_557717 [Mycena pura]
MADAAQVMYLARKIVGPIVLLAFAKACERAGVAPHRRSPWLLLLFLLRAAACAHALPPTLTAAAFAVFEYAFAPTWWHIQNADLFEQPKIDPAFLTHEFGGPLSSSSREEWKG